MLWYFKGVVSHSGDLQVSQYVVSVESSCLTHHIPLFTICLFLVLIY